MQDQLILNRYRPISEAGSGGYATVQLAWDTRIQRRVAIKCIQLKEEDVLQGTLPGLDEARTAALLNDATIVGVHDFEVQGNIAYLIMEYVDGLTLTQLLKNYGNELTLDAVAAIFSSVARALEIAHENQILHLDIKPDNVLINRQGQVKVTDFGLATLSDALGFSPASGGTIGYMPPEQMRLENLDVRCDEWALASMTYEIFAGKNPFFARNLRQAEKVIEDAELVLPSLCRGDLESGIDDVIFYALDPDREERYRSITDFAEEMERFLGNPVKGQRELAVLVGQATEDYEEEDSFSERIPLFDRLSNTTKAVLSRVWSFFSVGILSFVGLSNMSIIGGWTSPLFWGLFAIVGLGALFKPHLGALLGLIALDVALFMNEAYLVALLLLVVTLAWWFFIARWGDRQANTALAPVLFGSFGFNQISPLLTGFMLTMKDTVLNTLFALFLSIVLAGFGSVSLFGWNVFDFWSFERMNVQANILTLLAQPMTWCVVVSWLLAATVMRLFCLRNTRLFAFMGTLASTGVLLVGVLLGSWFTHGQFSPMAELYPLIATLAAGLLMSCICSLGVPVRDTDDEELLED